jgi:hypothetical protein
MAVPDLSGRPPEPFVVVLQSDNTFTVYEWMDHVLRSKSRSDN